MSDKSDTDFEKWANTPPSKLDPKEVPLFFESTFPQYRKNVIVDGAIEQKHLDGTETAETEIVEYKVSEQYQKWRAAVMANLSPE